MPDFDKWVRVLSTLLLIVALVLFRVDHDFAARVLVWLTISLNVFAIARVTR